MKKPIFHFEDENYKAFEDYLFTFMPVNKCKDIYVIINCMEDIYDHIQINGQIQKTCSPETPAYTIVRNIMYWYIDWVDEIENFLYDNCNCYDMTITEEEVRYEKILKTLKKYTARKNPELDNFFGGNDMKKHIFESDQETFINELNDIVNEKGKLTEKDLDLVKKQTYEDYEKKIEELDNVKLDTLLKKVDFVKILGGIQFTEPEESTSPEPITDVKDVTRESLLDGAYKCICCDRNKQYGSPEDNFGIIARYWKEYLGVDITAMDVGVMMTLFKIGRMQSGGYKPDNFVDAIGYLACAGECGAKVNVDDTEKNNTKTYKDDFFEKFPNTITYMADRPAACRATIYGGECGGGDCTDCWNQSYEEE